MHPIEIMLGIGVVAAPVTATAAAIRWKKAFASRSAGWRYWLTLVSLCLSTSVAVIFILMLFRARVVDFYVRYDEYLLWLRMMTAVSLLAVIAAGFGRGAGRVLSLLTAGLVFGFIVLVAAIPP
jgi:hypothetical protein